MLDWGNRTFAGVVIGAGSVLTALLLHPWISNQGQITGLLLYLIAVLLAAWAGGRKSGVLVVVFSLLAVLFVRSASLPVSPDVLALLLFTILGLAIRNGPRFLDRSLTAFPG